MGIRFSEGLNVIPLMIAEHVVDTRSAYVKVTNAQWISFLVGVGDADTAIIVTLESSSANSSNASEVQVGFKYRLSGSSCAGSDTYTAITWASGDAGYTWVEATDTGKMAIIDVDPSSLTEGHGYMRVCFDATAYSGVTPAIFAIAILEPRYPQKEHLSAT
jgi:hypothetical protein